MSTPTPVPEAPKDLKLLTVLPALAVLAVVTIFGLQAMRVPAGPPHAAAPGHEPPLRQSLSSPDAHHTNASGSDELPKLGQIQPFTLIESREKSITQADLQGKVWVADFIFTTCQAECPLMSAEMQKLQNHFKDEKNLRMMSFSVDPETDTPAVLSEYAKRYGADERWLFTTGPRDLLYQIAIESFKLPAQDLREGHQHATEPDKHAEEHAAEHGVEHGSEHKPDAQSKPAGAPAASSPFLHSQKFVLVDQQLQIRGYYDSNDPAALATLIEKDLPQLLHSP